MINSALMEINSDVRARATCGRGGLLCVVPEGEPDRVTFRFNLNNIKQQPRSDPGREKEGMWLEKRSK